MNRLASVAARCRDLVQDVIAPAPDGGPPPPPTTAAAVLSCAAPPRPGPDPEPSVWGLVPDDAASARGGSRGPASDGSPQLELDAAVGAKRPRLAPAPWWSAGGAGPGVWRAVGTGGSPGRLEGLMHVAQHELGAVPAAATDRRCAAPSWGGRVGGWGGDGRWELEGAGECAGGLR